MRLGTGRLWSVSNLLLAVWLLLTSPAPAADRVLLTFKSKPYTCEDLTFVRYDDGVILAKSNLILSADMVARAFPRGSLGRDPGVGYWEPTVPLDPAALYHHQLNGVIERFVAYQIFQKFLERYPDSPALKQYDLAEVDRYIHLKAVRQDEYGAALTPALQQAHDGATFFARMRAFFPEDRSPAAQQQLYQGWTPMGPVFAFDRACFPLMKGDQVAPWYHQSCLTDLIKYHLVEEINLHKAKYIEALEDEFADCEAFVFVGLRADQRKRVEKILAEFAGPSAIASEETHRQLAKAMAQQPEVHYMFTDFPKRLLADRTGIPMASLKPHTFLVISDTNKVEQLVDSSNMPQEFLQPQKAPAGASPPETQHYLYIIFQKADPQIKYDSRPPSFLYDTALEMLLPPIYAEVMRDVQVGEGFKTPGGERMLAALGRGSALAWSNLHGVKLPKVVPY